MADLGAGKSTIAAGLFYNLKIQKYEVELVTEYAKSLVWEERSNILKDDQLYIFAKQHRKIFRLLNKVDYVICDSPLILNMIYFDENNKFYSYDVKDCFLNIFNLYENINIFLDRNLELVFNENGRYQTFNEAKIIDNKILKLLNENNILYNKIQINENTLTEIQKIVNNNIK